VEDPCSQGRGRGLGLLPICVLVILVLREKGNMKYFILPSGGKGGGIMLLF